MRDRGGFFSSCSAMALGLILPARVGSALAEGYPQNAGWPREWHPSWTLMETGSGTSCWARALSRVLGLGTTAVNRWKDGRCA